MQTLVISPSQRIFRNYRMIRSRQGDTSLYRPILRAEQLRGVSQGAEVIFLGPDEWYRQGAVLEFLHAILVRDLKVTRDNADRYA